jgi:peptidoglycan/LPS O-acetylase OafA/YrhL
VAAGRISFSLYLVHMPVIIFSAHGLGSIDRPVGLALLACVIVVSWALASAGWRCVERPSIRTGNRLCAWLSRRTGSDPLPSALPAE